MDAMELLTEAYVAQRERWPGTGRHILVDDASVVVYQAYRSTIGRFAATRGYFGGAFSLNRMSWIKPNFPVADSAVATRLGLSTVDGQQ